MAGDGGGWPVATELGRRVGGRGGEVEDDSVDPEPPRLEFDGEKVEGNAAAMEVRSDWLGVGRNDGDHDDSGGGRRSRGADGGDEPGLRAPIPRKGMTMTTRRSCWAS